MQSGTTSRWVEGEDGDFGFVCSQQLIWLTLRQVNIYIKDCFKATGQAIAIYKMGNAAADC